MPRDLLRHVGERLGRDRLRPLPEVERNLTREGSRGAGVRRAQRGDARPEDDEIVVDVQVAEVDRQLLARIGVHLEVVPVGAARRVAEIERVGLDGRHLGLGVPVPRLARLVDRRGGRGRAVDGSVEPGGVDLRARQLDAQAEARLRLEGELVGRPELDAGDRPAELVLGQRQRRLARGDARPARERRRARRHSARRAAGARRSRRRPAPRTR